MLGKSQVKYIQSLGHKKHRDEDGVFIAEGPKIIGEWLQVPDAKFVRIYALPEWINANPTRDIEVVEVTPDELAKISQLQTPNQVLGILRKMPVDAEPDAQQNLVLVLDTIQDPGNLGTIIRIADWFGVTQIVCGPDSADRYNPKVVQSAMGSLIRVNILYTPLARWLSDLPASTRIYAAVLEGRDVKSTGMISKGVLVIGNESKGISPEVMERVNVRITIPRKGGAESLNAAVATGIILSHVTS